VNQPLKRAFIGAYLGISAVIPQLNVSDASSFENSLILVSLGLASLLIAIASIYWQNRWSFIIALASSLLLMMALLGEDAVILLFIFFPLHLFLGWTLTLDNERASEANSEYQNQQTKAEEGQPQVKSKQPADGSGGEFIQ